jgi:D-glycero-D-manno-heptose 1,7-bisphosphate phosphatase
MKLAILDRDGVINYDSKQFIKSPAEWRPIPGSLEAIAKLTQSGYRVVVATNQSGSVAACSTWTRSTPFTTRCTARCWLPAGASTRSIYCPHAGDAGCRCRKPQTGMFERIAGCFNIDLAGTPAVGDSLRDLQAAARGRRDAAPGADRQGRPDARRRRSAGRNRVVCRSGGGRREHHLCHDGEPAHAALHAPGQSADDAFRDPRDAGHRLADAHPLPHHRPLARGFMALCHSVLGMRYRVVGRENIPAEPSVVLLQTSVGVGNGRPAGDLSAAGLRPQARSCCASPSSAGGWRR